MLNFLRKLISNDLYIQVWPDRIKVTNLSSKMVFDETPLMAIRENSKGVPIVEAIGDKVKCINEVDGYKIINPFMHPRLLVHDFQAGEKIIQHIFQTIHEHKFFAPSPRVIFQPMDRLEGGVTEIEKRVYRELCLGAGAREIHIHIGSELSIYNINFEELRE